MMQKKSSQSTFTPADIKFMNMALELAAKGAGYVSPNPMVGCVIVSHSGKVIAKGYHERFGQAHAEINALKKVKDRSDLVDAVMYVTLEPCSHHGKTPPCADTICELPLKRVVIAMVDPNPKVSGRGMERIRKAGILVETGLLEEEARELNEAFLHFIRFGKPFVTMKMAQTLDGYVAAPDGSSQWITGEQSRERVHHWRSRYDAVMVGRNTVMNDNPRLTVRHVDGRQPYRIVIDGPHVLDRKMDIFSDQFEEKTIVITHNREAFRSHADPMLSLLSPTAFRGKTLLVDELNGHTDLDQAFYELGKLGIASILIEPGRDLASALIRDNLVDKIHAFIAPKILGGGARSILGVGLNSIQEIIELRRTSVEQVGNDVLLTGYF